WEGRKLCGSLLVKQRREDSMKKPAPGASTGGVNHETRGPAAGGFSILAIFAFSHFFRAQETQTAGVSDLTRYLEEVQSKLQLRGAAVLVGRADGTILYRRFFGDYTPATVVPVQSVTKWWSAAILESLAEKGRLDLDRPIATYLADVPPDKSAITI